MPPRPTYSIDEIKQMLLDQIDAVVARYAPAVQGSYTQHGRYFTLNPGRADRRVGSFCIRMSGPDKGRWNDYAIGLVPGQGFGDVLDLIALHHGCGLPDALREARAFLGLQVVSAEDNARRRAAVDRQRRLAAEARQKEREDEARRARQALRLWLSGRAHLRGSPADHYLRGRGINLEDLGRQPGVLRYVPECFYRRIDDETGEVFEGRYPAMVAAITNAAGATIACHRTYLAIARDGWRKADLPDAKKVLGHYAGGYIPIWKGAGPRGGKAAPLHQAAPGQHVYIAEGIEDALSAVVLLGGEARVLASVSLTNPVELPATVGRVTLIADRDEGPQQRAALGEQIARHQAAGRRVHVWLNAHGGKDLNDALRAAVLEDQPE